MAVSAPFSSSPEKSIRLPFTQSVAGLGLFPLGFPLSLFFHPANSAFFSFYPGWRGGLFFSASKIGNGADLFFFPFFPSEGWVLNVSSGKVPQNLFPPPFLAEEGRFFWFFPSSNIYICILLPFLPYISPQVTSSAKG